MIALVLVVLGGVGSAIAAGIVIARDAKVYLGDLFDTVEPPEASAEVGEWFTTDDGDLRIKVTSLECRADLAGDVGCTFAFDVQNRSDGTVTLNDITVKSVIDGGWGSADVAEPDETGVSYASITVPAGSEKSLTGTVSPGSGRLDGLVFDANDASSHSAVVVDARPAWEQAQPAGPGDEPAAE